MVKPLEEENFERKNGGGRWIRTIEVSDSRFTVCPLWPLGNPTTTLERVKGIEPSQSAWKADVLPLNYIRIIGAEDEIRTRDPRLGKAMLYH